MSHFVSLTRDESLPLEAFASQLFSVQLNHRKVFMPFAAYQGELSLNWPSAVGPHFQICHLLMRIIITAIYWKRCMPKILLDNLETSLVILTKLESQPDGSLHMVGKVLSILTQVV